MDDHLDVTGCEGCKANEGGNGSVRVPGLYPLARLRRRLDDADRLRREEEVVHGRTMRGEDVEDDDDEDTLVPSDVPDVGHV